MVIYFDGSICEQSEGPCVMFITPQGVPIPYSFKLNFPYTNNNAEYEALILAIKTIIKLELIKVKFIGYSLLIINQVKEVFQCKEPLLQKYKRLVNNLLSYVENYDLEVAPRSTNRFVDAMASIGYLMLANPNKKQSPLR